MDRKLSPDEAINRFLMVPYVRNGSTLAGFDCFGLVECWYRLVLGIELSDRAGQECSNEGLQNGFDHRGDWQELGGPEDHCAVVMQANRHPAGHIGVFFRGSLLHTDLSHGCVCQPITHRFLRTRITGYFTQVF